MLEGRGIATCTFSQREEISRITRPPRLLVVDGAELGYPLGSPGDLPRQRELVRAALEMFEKAAPEEVWHR